MALFEYQAIDSLGKRKKGFIEAQTDKEAKEKLRDMGVMVITLAVKAKVSGKQNLYGDSLLAFTLQLSQLVGAGVPLYESLVGIEKQSREEPYHRVVLSLCEQIKAGTSLSQAMSTYPESFNKLYCSMIAAGEAVGSVGVVLDKLALLLSRQMKLRGEAITAMVYPAILASFSFLIIIMLLGFVVPSIEGIFSERKLNGFTRFVLGVSHFFRDYWWIYLPLIVGVVIYVYMKLRTSAGRLWIERNSLKVPLLSTLVIQSGVARFCRTMGTLLQGGLPFIDALKISREVIRNVVLEDEIRRAEARIIEGSTLGTELAKAKLFPSMVSQMLSVGEESGSTIQMFNRIADMYEGDVEKTLARLMALSQPVILIVMGTIIGMVLLAILLPLTDVSSLAV